MCPQGLLHAHLLAVRSRDASELLLDLLEAVEPAQRVVRVPVLLAVLLHKRADSTEAVARECGEEMVLNLVVEAALNNMRKRRG